MIEQIHLILNLIRKVIKAGSIDRETRIRQAEIFRAIQRLTTIKQSFLWSTGYVQCLDQKGQLRSGEPLILKDSRDQPIPWWNYAVIDFLSGRISKHLTVFEYGSGSSTLWFSRLAESVTAVEHDLGWHDLIEGMAPSNVNLLYRPETDIYSYINSIRMAAYQPDIVVVDGILRVECIRALIQVVKASCVVILDDSDDVEERTGKSYAEGIDLLTENGYKRIDFRSFKGLAVDQYQTSIFYKIENCLNL